MSKKYVGLDTLRVFLSNLNSKFATLSHKHTISDITDYKVDTELSSTSTNPVQNKVINDEFDAIAGAMNVLEQAIDNLYFVDIELEDAVFGEANLINADTLGGYTLEEIMSNVSLNGAFSDTQKAEIQQIAEAVILNGSW